MNDYDTIEELKDEAKEKFVGVFSSFEDLGQEMFSEFIAPFIQEGLRNTVEYHFDKKGYGEEFANDWYEEDGYYYDTNR